MSRERHHEAFFKVHRTMTSCVTEAPYASDEKGLFQSVCDILVRSELFQLAWFGYAARNTQRVAEPIACSGDTGGFIGELKRALSREDYEDPASICIRTGDACWINDISGHPGLEAMRPAIQRRGFTSVISVPAISKDVVSGALTLYYRDPEEYGQEHVTVLKEQLSHVHSVFAARSPNPRPRSEELEAELRGLIDALPITVGLSNAEGLLLHLNRRQVETTGYTVEDHVFRGAMLKYIHPDDVTRVYAASAEGIARGAPFEYEVRHLHIDNQYHWLLVHGAPIRDQDGHITRWCATGTDIQQLKQAEEKLRQSEAELLEAQRISHTGSWKHDLASGTMTITLEMTRIFGIEPDEDASTSELFFGRIHAEDRPGEAINYKRAALTKAGFESDYRIVLPNGSVRHVHNIAHPKLNEAGDLVEFVGTVIDVTAAKEAEGKIRQSEKEARQLLDLSPLHITELGPDGTRIYNNQAALEYYGLALEEWQGSDFQRLFHPQDAELAVSEVPGKLQDGSPFEYEARLKRRDGQYRWFHYRCNPMLDELGRITRWYCAGTDIEDRKAAEQRLQDENISLREDLDKASMFEEIVGSSAALKKVLSHISKVAPTDSSVLITGETGTGKELVARAIHRRSRRSSHTFVSVNCAAIPRDLIASELFGHEEGAFTGATQRRLGRFELAEKGTIFLDEVGELPAETQIALLRVLQEREFERMGGSGSIRTDVRVVAATNRDLEAAIAAGTFRSDLYYRLNVFPIEMPTLRERSEDIPLLVAYFLNRYARKAGRHFTALDRKSLNLLQSYAWPGNIRELQNVIERSVIVSESQTFSVDQSWLSRRPSPPALASQPNLFNRLPAEEKALIEAALRECGGRVYGPSGAAARLGIPRTTLESKIRSLKINKNRFRGPDPSKDS